MTPDQEWDGPIQDAIRAWDIEQGHAQTPTAGSHQVVFFHPPTRPNGGTVYMRPEPHANPYAHIDGVPVVQRPVVTVELPPFEEES